MQLSAETRWAWLSVWLSVTPPFGAVCQGVCVCPALPDLCRLKTCRSVTAVTASRQPMRTRYSRVRPCQRRSEAQQLRQAAG